MPDQTFHFILKTLSPVHMGCGEVYEPTSFVVDEKEKELVHFDPDDFLERLTDEELKKFSEICQKGTPYSLIEIYKFINSHKTLAEGERIAVSNGFASHYKKTLDLSENDKGKIKNEINKFKIERTAFQSQDGSPYIPGSAIKGAIRTAVLNARHKKQSGSLGRADQVETKLLGGGFSEDPFSLVKVSDFVALPETKRRILYAVIRKKKASKHDARGPAQILEIIEPEMKFFGSITLRENKNPKLSKPITIEEFNDALSSFYLRELKREQAELRGLDSNFSLAPSENISLLRLGRHSGAECLTIEGLREIKIMQGGGKPSKTMPQATTLWLASDQSNPKENIALKAFGWASLHLLSNEETKQIKDVLETKRKSFFEKEREKLQKKNALLEESCLKALEKEKRQKQIKEEEERRKEEEARYPWRKYLPELARIEDWGALKQKVLDNIELKNHQSEAEVGEAVQKAALRVQNQNPKKWTPERDQEIEEWLMVSGVVWEKNQPKRPGTELPPVPPFLNFKNWNEYKALNLAIEDFPMDDVKALHKKFKDMEWHKAKGDKKAEWDKLEKLRKK